MAAAEHGEWRLGHRPALDGLRGIAVLLVIAAHLRIPGLVGGGITGVTLFFALSGFLITSLLLEELQRKGQVSFRSFYRRRALRLLPAVAVVIVVFSAWDAIAERRVPVGHDALAAIFYVANLFRARGDGLGSLGHMWSLAIEEQFYLVWPVALLVVARRPRAAIIGLVGLAVVVAAHRLALWHGGAPQYRVQFGTDTRVDTILLGSALGLALCAGYRLRVPRWLWCAAVGVFVLCSRTTSFNSTYEWSLTAAGIAAVVMVAYLVTAPPPKVFERPALVWAGKRSYGLYLWHIPINWAVQTHLAAYPAAVRALVMLSITLVAVVSSYELVERPFLRLKQSSGHSDGAGAPATAGTQQPQCMGAIGAPAEVVAVQ